jgi:dUTP pyrophosphatase
MKRVAKEFNPKAKQKEIDAIESDDPVCGRKFNRTMCLARHNAAKRKEREGKRLEYEPCAYCPKILKMIETEKESKMSEKVLIKVKRFHPSARIPEYKTAGAAGFDLRAMSCGVIHPGKSTAFELGLGFEIPEGFEIQIRPRSGLSFDTPLMAKNTVGTVDSDYRGEVRMLLYNTGDKPCHIAAGDRICQGVLARVPRAEFVEVEELAKTERGTRGFGSTGVK